MLSAHEPLDVPVAARVLVVDDEPHITRLLSRMLAHDGYEVLTAETIAAAREVIDAQAPDVIILDVMLPDSDGITLCQRIKQNATTRLTPVVLMTGLNDDEVRIRGLEAGADDFLDKPIDTRVLVARVGALARVKRYTDDLDAAGSIIMTLATMIETRDGQTDGHCHRMANYATALGRALGLSPSDVQALHRGGFLHDIGMLTIPDTVLRTAGPLSHEELDLIKSHPVAGDRICAHLRSLQSVRPIIRHHHERFDGSGYPDGLRGDDIPVLAQIIGVVDVYEAVTSRRPYQPTLPASEAIRVLHAEAQRGWRRRDLVDGFTALLTHRHFDAVPNLKTTHDGLTRN
jgi:putative two-component system response regulator